MKNESINQLADYSITIIARPATRGGGKQDNCLPRNIQKRSWERQKRFSVLGKTTGCNHFALPKISLGCDLNQ